VLASNPVIRRDVGAVSHRRPRPRGVKLYVNNQLCHCAGRRKKLQWGNSVSGAGLMAQAQQKGMAITGLWPIHAGAIRASLSVSRPNRVRAALVHPLPVASPGQPQGQPQAAIPSACASTAACRWLPSASLSIASLRRARPLRWLSGPAADRVLHPGNRLRTAALTARRRCEAERGEHSGSGLLPEPSLHLLKSWSCDYANRPFMLADLETRSRAEFAIGWGRVVFS